VNRISIIILVLIATVCVLIGAVVGSWATNQTIGIIIHVTALLVALVAMLTAAGTLLTVRQIQRQMEASYRPELTFARVFLKGEAESSECPLPTKWTERPRFTETASTIILTPLTPAPSLSFYTSLYNIGLEPRRASTLCGVLR